MDTVFEENVPQPSPFVEPEVLGTGNQTTDDFISARVGLMMDHDDALKALQVSQSNVQSTDKRNITNLIDGAVGKTIQSLRISSLDRHAEAMDVEGGVAADQELTQVLNEDTDIKRLAAAAPMYLDQFKEYIPREVAKRQYTAMLFAKKLEEVGITPDTYYKKGKGLVGMMIPGKALLQFGTSGIDFTEAVERLHSMNDEEFFNALPDMMDTILKMSGNNPFYFLERMQAFLDPDDVNTIKAFLALDAFDAATTAVAIPKLIKALRLARATNTPIKMLRDSGQAKKAAELNVAAAGDEAAAATAKTTQSDAAQSTSPFGGEGIDPDITEGIAAESQALIAERRVEVLKTLAPLNDDTFLLRRTAYTESEIAKANEKYLSKFAGNARIIEQGTDGFTAEVAIQRPNIWPSKQSIQDKLIELRDLKKAYKQSYKDAPKSTGQKAYLQEMIDQTRDEIVRLEKIADRIAGHSDSPRPVTLETVQVKYRNNDFGQLEAIQYDKAFRHVTSPSTTIEQMMKDIVENATLYDFDTARVVDVFFRARNAAIKGLGKKSKKNVDSILLQGDKDQVVYTDMDLVNGVRTPDGIIKLGSVEEVGAYRSIRDTFDVLFELKNKELRRQLELGGFEAIHLKGKNVDVNFVNPNKVVSLEDRAKIKRIYNASTDTVEDAERLRADPNSVLNHEIYELKYPLEVGDELVNYVVTPKSRIKPLPKIVLNRRDGYVPKIDKNVFWVSEMIGDKIVDGNTVKNYRTVVRYFDNKQEADTWERMQAAKGQLTEIRSGREWLDLAPGRREEFEANIFGGLYGGKRGERPVPFGLEGTEAERVGGIEAMEAYMNHIASRMPAVDFRASLVQRFLNSAKNPKTGESYLKDPADWRSDVLTTIDNKQYSGLRAMQDWVADQLRIPTTEERVWGNVSQKLAEITSRVPGTAGRKLSKWSMQIGAKDAFTQLRGLSFHATLGWFNPSQFFVQAMGASLAASLHPEKLPILLPRSLALRAAMFASSDDVLRMCAKAALMNEDDFIKMVRAYQKTGLHESTLSTGDYAALQGMPQGLDNFRWLANKGLIFFKEGERWARNYAWIQAYDEVTKGGKLAKGVSKVPPVPEGSVRFYHGAKANAPKSGEGRWVSQDYKYAEDYADGGKVYYVDVPESELQKMKINKAFDDTGTSQKSPYVHFEYPDSGKMKLYESVSVGGLTDKMIDDITKLHLKYTLNLNRANRAFWQKGILSIPTQFYQISTKFIENMLPNILINTPNGWTGKQKAFILTGQVALFGAAGIPFGRTMYDSLAHYLQSEDDYGLAVKDPKLVAAIQGGMTEFLMYDWTGARLDITNRLSIPAGIESLVEIMSSDQSTMADKVLGVSGEIGSRTWEATRAIGKILYASVQSPDSIDASLMQEVLIEAGRVASSYRNYHKARLWERLHYIEDRYHNKIIPIDDVDDRALLFAQSIGVAPKILDDFYAIKNFNTMTDRDYRDAVNAIMTHMNTYYGDPDILTNVHKQKRLDALIALTNSAFEPEERVIVMQRLKEKMAENNYKLPEEMEKALDNLYNKHGASDLQGNATMIETK